MLGLGFRLNSGLGLVLVLLLGLGLGLGVEIGSKYSVGTKANSRVCTAASSSPKVVTDLGLG